MAWILLNIHRATEAMGRAAVFYCGATLAYIARLALSQRLAYLMFTAIFCCLIEQRLIRILSVTRPNRQV